MDYGLKGRGGVIPSDDWMTLKFENKEKELKYEDDGK